MATIYLYDKGLSSIVVASGRPGSAVGLITGTLLPTASEGCLIDSANVNATSRYAVNYSLARVPYFYLFGPNLVKVTISGRIFRYQCATTTVSQSSGINSFYTVMEASAPWNYVYWQVNFPDESGQIFRGLLVSHNSNNTSNNGLVMSFSVALLGMFIA